MHITGGSLKNRKIFSFPGEAVRPTSSMVRQALFNILGPRIEGAAFLDLFAGNGTVGFEALSRGAREVTFVEKSPRALEYVRKNIAALPAELQGQVSFFKADCFSGLNFLQAEGHCFDIIFLDPPYYRREELKGKSGELIETILRAGVLEDGGWIVFQHECGEIRYEGIGQGFTKIKDKKYGRTTLAFFEAVK